MMAGFRLDDAPQNGRHGQYDPERGTSQLPGVLLFISCRFVYRFCFPESATFFQGAIAVSVLTLFSSYCCIRSPHASTRFMTFEGVDGHGWRVDGTLLAQQQSHTRTRNYIRNMMYVSYFFVQIVTFLGSCRASIFPSFLKRKIRQTEYE